MPTKKPPPPDEKPQRERFMEAAKKVGANESGKVFEQAMKKIVPQCKGKKA